jgi:hypothetical protein
LLPYFIWSKTFFKKIVSLSLAFVLKNPAAGQNSNRVSSPMKSAAPQNRGAFFLEVGCACRTSLMMLFTASSIR